MDEIGLVLNEEAAIDDTKSRAEQKEAERRIKRGECPTCARKTHKVNKFTRKKTPISKEGEVLNGQCLLCETREPTPDISAESPPQVHRTSSLRAFLSRNRSKQTSRSFSGQSWAGETRASNNESSNRNRLSLPVGGDENDISSIRDFNDASKCPADNQTEMQNKGSKRSLLACRMDRIGSQFDLPGNYPPGDNAGNQGADPDSTGSSIEHAVGDRRLLNSSDGEEGASKASSNESSRTPSRELRHVSVVGDREDNRSADQHSSDTPEQHGENQDTSRQIAESKRSLLVHRMGHIGSQVDFPGIYAAGDNHKRIPGKNDSLSSGTASASENSPLLVERTERSINLRLSDTEKGVVQSSIISQLQPPTSAIVDEYSSRLRVEHEEEKHYVDEINETRRDEWPNRDTADHKSRLKPIPQHRTDRFNSRSSSKPYSAKMWSAQCQASDVPAVSDKNDTSRTAENPSSQSAWGKGVQGSSFPPMEFDDPDFVTSEFVTFSGRKFDDMSDTLTLDSMSTKDNDFGSLIMERVDLGFANGRIGSRGEDVTPQERVAKSSSVPRPLDIRKDEIHSMFIKLTAQGQQTMERASFDLKSVQPPSGGTAVSVSPRQRKTMATADEIPDILSCLTVHERNVQLHIGAFVALATLLLASDEGAKVSFVVNEGIKSVVQAMWNHMEDAKVQQAGMDLLWALSATRQDGRKNDCMSEQYAEGAADAIMISMQTHSSIPRMQESGCGVLCCLASASARNSRINDGTTSGAILAVLSAMERHKSFLPVLFWGLRALVNQCAKSDANRVCLAKSVYEGAGTGVIESAMRDRNELIIVEWACKLFWHLTTSKEAAEVLTATANPAEAILKGMRRFQTNEAVSPMMEAAFSALSNFALHTKDFHASLVQAGGIQFAIDVIRMNNAVEGVQLGACSLLGNLATTAENRSAIVRGGGVFAIVSMMKQRLSNLKIQEEGCRALASLCINSIDAKLALSSDDAMCTIVEAMQVHADQLPMQQMATGLLSTLGVRIAGQRSIIAHGGLRAVIDAMNTFPADLMLNEIATRALRNVVTLEEDADALMTYGILPIIIKAMYAHPSSSMIQGNACSVLWELSVKASKDPISFVEAGAVKHIVKAMQCHLECPDVQEMGAGALWSLMAMSNRRKKIVADAGGIDALVCVLFIHQNSEKPVNQALGALACFSSHRDFAPSIVDAKGISAVAECMLANSITEVLESGCVFMRNMALISPWHADETSCAVTAIVRALRCHPDAVALQREGLCALWAMTFNSNVCREKIESSSGMDVIVKSMDHNSFVSDVQQAAQGIMNNMGVS